MQLAEGNKQSTQVKSEQSESELDAALPPPVGNSSSIRYREGAQIVLPGGPSLSSQAIFRIAIIGSMALRGKPVRCEGIVPGVIMVIAAGNVTPTDGVDADRIADKLWSIFRPQLVGWLTARTAPGGMHLTVSRGIQIDCGHEGRYNLPQAVMQIEARYDAAFAASFVKLLRQGRLIEPEAGSDDDMRSLVKTAIDCCVRSEDDMYARLPLPVRYRAGGAIDAWKAVRRAAGRDGEAFSRSLAREEIGTLQDEFADRLRRWCGRPLAAIAGESGAWHAGRSLVWQAFDACEGALYEPTPALHRLLDDAYIADDVPVGMIELPLNALCIVPDPSWWSRDGGIDAITLFRHGHDTGTDHPGILTFIAWTHHRQREHRFVDVLQLSLADPQRTIRSMLDEILPPDVLRGDGPYAMNLRAFWSQVLDYAIKMLLYLTVRDAQIVHDRAYSNAPRNLAGLGKRKREQRLAEIEMLYDRHVVGPAILDLEPVAGAHCGPGDQREVRGHWRRPHFKMQPHGPQSSLRKLVFIGPTLVRPDRLAL